VEEDTMESWNEGHADCLREIPSGRAALSRIEALYALVDEAVPFVAAQGADGSIPAMDWLVKARAMLQARVAPAEGEVRA
jgi:hypothetical protein